jgi:deoxyadenosine/deoxycytidine kinase
VLSEGVPSQMLLPARFRYIVVEGPIGAGKTSLAQRLASRLSAELVLEAPDENPFLPRFYEEPARHALATQLFFLFQRILATQLFFLFQRIQQLRDLKQIDLFAGTTVSDFLFDKDALFARLNLADDELHLYQQIYSQLAPQAPVPDLVIYLQASHRQLFERVRGRNIAYERYIDERYLGMLADEYQRFFYQFDAAPLLIVNSDRLNFVDDEADFDLLLQRIGEMKGPRAFFSKGD